MKIKLLFKCVLTMLLLSSSSVNASNYFYIEDFEVSPSQIGKLITVEVQGYFDNWVSAWQFDFILPEGLTVYSASRGSDMDVQSYNSVGELVTYSASFMTGYNNTMIIGVFMQKGYDVKGNCYGVVKWCPGHYPDMWSMTFRVGYDFRGGDIVMQGKLSCGKDNRPTVIPCESREIQRTCHVEFTGETTCPDEYIRGNWLVLDDTIYKRINVSDTFQVNLENYIPNVPVPYYFLFNGNRYGALEDYTKTLYFSDDETNALHYNGKPYLLESGSDYNLHINVRNYRSGLFFTCDPIYNVANTEITSDKVVIDTKYYNLLGQEVKDPKGINIAVITYDDGTMSTLKVLR